MNFGPAAYNKLFQENAVMLERLGHRHDLKSIRTIEIQVPFPDRQTALVARAAVKSSHEIPKGVILVVSRVELGDGNESVDLQFELQSIPTAELITTYEVILRDVAAQFGGGESSWMIHP
jgi:hypothetical protein